MASITLNWDNYLNEILPYVVNKYNLTPKTITTKKIWDKIKDMKLTELGLGEHMVDKSLRLLYNNIPVYTPSTESPRPRSTTTRPASEIESPQKASERPSLTRPKSFVKLNTSQEKWTPYRPSNSGGEDTNIREFRQKLNILKADASPEGNTAPSKEEAAKSFKESAEIRYSTIEDPTLGESKDNVEISLTGSDTSIQIKEVLDDSPMFRQKLKAAEDDMIEFAAQLKNMIKLCKDVSDMGTEYSRSMSRLAGGLTQFTSNYNVNIKAEVPLENGLARLAKHLTDLETSRLAWLTDTSTYLMNPMEALLTVDIKDMRKRSRKFERKAEKYEMVQSKINKQNYTKKAEMELQHAKSKLHLAGLELAFGINELDQKRKYKFMESICQFMIHHCDFQDKSHHMTELIRPLAHNLYAALLKRTDDLQEQHRDAIAKKRNTMAQLLNSIPADLSSKATTKQGYLFKRKGQIKQQWKKHFFTVHDGMMIEKKEMNVVHCFQLLTCTVKQRPDLDKRCFEIVSPEKNYILQTESAEQMQEWVSVLQNVILSELNAQPSRDSVPTLNASSPMTKIQEFSKDNCICADCGAPDPDWASINLGVVTCIECSGIHRSLGVHISKVRSLTLDKWSPELIELMSKLGNGPVNAIFEAAVPSTMKKPTAKSERDSREKWIRAKYEHRQFLAQPKGVPGVKELFDVLKTGDLRQLMSMVCYLPSVDVPNPSLNNRTPLLESVNLKLTIVALFLILNGGDAGYKDTQGWNALHHAASKGDPLLCRVLMKNATDKSVADATDKAGFTPLQLASVGRNTECMSVFLDYQK